MSLSEQVRGELAAIDPKRPCCRLAELSALVAGRGDPAPARSAAASPSTSICRAPPWRGARSRCCAGSASRRRSARTAASAFGRETRYELHLGEDPRAVQVLNEAGVVDTGLAPARRSRRAGSSRGRAAAPATCAERSWRQARSAARATPHLELRTATRDGAELLAALAAEEGLRLGRRRAAAPRRRLREGPRGDRGAARPRRRPRRRALAGGERGHRSDSRSGEPARERRPREPRPREPLGARLELRAIRRLAARGDLDELPPDLREAAELRAALSRRSRCASSPRGSRPPDDEGGRAPTPEEARAPRLRVTASRSPRLRSRRPGRRERGSAWRYV